LVPDTDSGSLIHFPDHCGIEVSDWHFSYCNRPIFVTLGEMTDADKMTNSQHFGATRQIFGSESGLIQKSGFESRITLVEVIRLGGGLHFLNTVYLYLISLASNSHFQSLCI